MAGTLRTAACFFLLVASGLALDDDVTLLVGDVLDEEADASVVGVIPETASDTLQDSVTAGADERIPGFALEEPDGAPAVSAAAEAPQIIERLKPEVQGYLFRACKCDDDVRFDAQLDRAQMNDLRRISNLYMADGNAPSRFGISNAHWAFGQLLDHDLVGLVDDKTGEEYTINLDHAEDDTIEMTLHRLMAKHDGDSQCRLPVTVTTPQLDAGPVYSPVEAFTQSTLREPGSCKLRATLTTGNREHLPLTTASEDGRVFFVAGDVRVNEHAVLTAMHTIFLREHNRLCDLIPADLGLCDAGNGGGSDGGSDGGGSKGKGSKGKGGKGGKGGWHWYEKFQNQRRRQLLSEDGTGDATEDLLQELTGKSAAGRDLLDYGGRSSGRSSFWSQLRRYGLGRSTFSWFRKSAGKQLGDVTGDGQGKYRTGCPAGQTFTFLNEDEKFELVRQTIMAKVQHITLNEFLPAFGISKEDVVKHKPDHDFPTIGVEFAAAGYRVGHDMIPNTIGAQATKELFGGEKYFLVSKTADGSGRRPRPDKVMDDLLRDVCATSSNRIDGKFSDSIRNVLFGAQPGSMFGEDLATRSLFRGHDMNLLGYEQMAQCFDSKRGNMAKEMLSNVQQPFALMLADNDEPDKQVLGPTLRNMLKDQFHRVLFGKDGGLFWTADEVGPFADEVRTSTLAKVINANTGANVQPNAFFV